MEPIWRQGKHVDNTSTIPGLGHDGPLEVVDLHLMQVEVRSAVPQVVGRQRSRPLKEERSCRSGRSGRTDAREERSMPERMLGEERTIKKNAAAGADARERAQLPERAKSSHANALPKNLIALLPM